jgi:predicted enzyme related to lactoylglutathione lyase
MPETRVRQFVLTLTSERPAALFQFYRDILGLEEEPVMGNALRAGGAILCFDRHGVVRGGAREPERHLINLVVDDISAEQARIEAHGVSFLRRKGRDASGAIVSTLLDPDGNRVQLFQPAHEGMA